MFVGVIVGVIVKVGVIVGVIVDVGVGDGQNTEELFEQSTQFVCAEKMVKGLYV